MLDPGMLDPGMLDLGMLDPGVHSVLLGWRRRGRASAVTKNRVVDIF